MFAGVVDSVHCEKVWYPKFLSRSTERLDMFYCIFIFWYTKCMYILYHFSHSICWNVKNILYSNFMIIYRLCKVLSFTWSMTLSSTIWFWILKTLSQQLNDKLNVGGWHLNPDVESQHRYESKYFHGKDLNNSYFVLFLWNKILYFHSHVKKIKF
jgi:hypothetical protein